MKIIGSLILILSFTFSDFCDACNDPFNDYQFFGQVTRDYDGFGIYGAHLTIVSQDGVCDIPITNPFGYYTSINTLRGGSTFILEVAAKGYQPQVRVVNSIPGNEEEDFQLTQ